jgi:hypothetical protein
MVGRGVIKINGELDQPEPKDIGVKVYVSLRVAGNRRDVMYARNLLFHRSFLLQSQCCQ